MVMNIILCRISVCKAGQASFNVLQVDEILGQPLQVLKINFWLVKIARSVASTNEAHLETLVAVFSLCLNYCHCVSKL